MSDTEKNLNMVVTREAWSDGDYRQDMRRDVDQLLIHKAAARWTPGRYEGITADITDLNGTILEQRHVAPHIDDSGVIAVTGTMTARITLTQGVAFSEVAGRLPDRLGRPKTLPDLLLALDQWRAQEAEDSIALDKIHAIYDSQGEASEVLPDLVARSKIREDELEEVAERLGIRNPLDAHERVGELLDELEDVRIKSRAAIEMLGAVRSLLVEKI